MTTRWRVKAKLFFPSQAYVMSIVYKLIFPLLQRNLSGFSDGERVCMRVEVPHHSLDCSVGLSFCAMWYKALIAFILNKGGFLSAERENQQSVAVKNWLDGFSRLPNSIQVIPNDQTSTFPSYWPSSIARITSGAILEEKEWEFKNLRKSFLHFHIFLLQKPKKTQNVMARKT